MAMELGARRIRKNLLVGLVGLQCGVSSNIVIAGLGISAIIQHFPWLLVPLKWLGVGYFLVLGTFRVARYCKSTLRPETDGSVPRTQHGDDKSAKMTFARSFLTNALNAKGIAFLVIFFPQFIHPDGSLVAQVLILGITTVIVDFMAMSLYAMLADRLAKWIEPGRSAWRDGVFGVIFVCCSVGMAL